MFNIFQDLGHRRSNCISSIPAVCSNPYQWNPGKKIFRAIIYLPNIVSAVALATMAAVCIQFQVRLAKVILDAIGLHKLADTPWLDTGHKFWALLFCLLLWHDRISYADLDERN